jgi:two-component system, NtrC family, sensor kinase
LKKELSVRAGIVLQLTMIAVASLSLLAVFSFRVIEITLERRHVEAAVSVAEVVRQAVSVASAEGISDPVSRIRPVSGLSPYIQQVTLLPVSPPGGEVVVTPVGKAISGILSIHPTVDVTLPLIVPVSAPGSPGGSIRSLRVRFHSPGVEREANNLVRVAALLLVVDVIALVVFGFFLMERTVVGPVRRLAAVSEKIASGDLDLRAAESPGNEVGQLGASFNRMVGAILEAQAHARNSQQDAFRSEKLATVGRLAAGVAHEMGNPLMAVRGYAEYLRKNHPPNEEGDECLDKILAETRRIETIVRGLLSAASPERPGEETAEINGIVREVVENLSFRKMFRNVEVRIEAGEVSRARISAERFRQVLLNLILNAVDAMGDGGTLTLRTVPLPSWTGPRLQRVRRRVSDPPDVDVVSRRTGELRYTGPGIGVCVEDTGRGIPGNERESIFDPFYTTKEPGKGTGLGLYLSRSIVETAGGEILCESEEGEGTRFTVILPAAEGGGSGESVGEGEPDG